jgi:nucleoside diphosphate kinase
MVQPTKEKAELQYQHYRTRNKKVYNENVDYLTKHPIIVMIWQGLI